MVTARGTERTAAVAPLVNMIPPDVRSATVIGESPVSEDVDCDRYGACDIPYTTNRNLMKVSQTHVGFRYSSFLVSVSYGIPYFYSSH